jgi:predicted ATPase/DNA-binding XRE family transcriptional regulator
MTQAELAETSGLSMRTVSDLERGLRAAVYPTTARQLAKAFRVEDEHLAHFLLAARGGQEQASPGARRFSPPPSAYRSRLPLRRTRLIGRETELATLLRLVLDNDVRLLTVLGPGGVGKTRLATEVAALTQDEFRGGTYFVDLSALDNPEMVLASIGSSVGMQPSSGDLVRSLAGRLGGGGVLLVLDTIEQLVAAAPGIGELVAACPSLTVVTTSRLALDLPSQHEIPLDPLTVDPGALGEATLAPASELFLERATSAGADLPNNPATLTTVNDICSRLDGMPLAIELAAPRVKHVPLAELLVQLDQRLPPLVGGRRDPPLHVETVRGTLDWSYDLLGADEMSLFRSLSVFRGGFGLSAAAAVATAADPAGSPEVLPTLSALVDSSLVVAEVGVSGEARYQLPDAVREYAVERAQSAGDFDQVQQRHSAYFLSLAERAEPELRGAKQQEWHRRLLDDEGNFRAVLTRCLQAGRADDALKLASGLWMFWRWAGLFHEGRGGLEAALAEAKKSPLGTRLQGLWGAGWLAYQQGDYGRTDQAGRQMLQLLTGADDGLHRRNALTLVGNAALGAGRGDGALTALSEALAICEEKGLSWHIGTSSLNLGTALLHESRATEARALLQRALAIYEELGDRHFTARTTLQLGYCALVSGDPKSARGYIHRGMSFAADLGDSWSIAEGLEAVAALSAAGSPRTTAFLGGAAERLRERISMRPQPADAIITDAYFGRARAQLAAEDFEIAWNEGRQTELESAVETALAANRAATRG